MEKTAGKLHRRLKYIFPDLKSEDRRFKEEPLERLRLKPEPQALNLEIQCAERQIHACLFGNSVVEVSQVDDNMLLSLDRVRQISRLLQQALKDLRSQEPPQSSPGRELDCPIRKAGHMQIIWRLDNLGEIGGQKPTVLGKPQVIEALGAPALYFDGRDDGLILNTNPLSGARSFTIEVIFRPDPSANKAQRFLHMQASEESRVLVETRLNDADEWFLDTFIKSGESEKTLQSKQTLHPPGRWYHAALTYDGNSMRHYVNGEEEMSGEVRYAPVDGGQTSIGCRLNQVFWFQGAIRTVRITHSVLSPSHFLDRPE